MRIDRPVWRRFEERFAARAADWVKRGGHAVIAYSPTKMSFVLPEDQNGRLSELGLWSLLAVEQRTARRVKSGPLRGLRTARVAPHSLDAVADWVERDGLHPGPTRRLSLDCLDCGACCVEADVHLDDDDLDTFREGGRADLTKSKYVKRGRDGKLRLRFLTSGKCQHLASDNKCQIYALRPYNCSVFPVGSEACLAARESTLGLRD